MAQRSRTSRKRIIGAKIVGFLVVVFAIIGIVSIIITIVNSISSLSNDSDQKLEYETLLKPILMNDPDPFDDITKAKNNFLIESTIWTLLTEDAHPDKYPTDDMGRQIITADIVDSEFVNLFGNDVSLNHMTIEGNGVEFEYDPENKCYYIPVSGVTSIYTPLVESIKQKGDTISLRVACIHSTSEWRKDSNGNLIPPSPDKYLNVTLRKQNSQLHISAIQKAD